MPTSKNRQLAAILFADIVGYTGLMQRDEADALTILNRFQSIIKNTAESYDGEIIKTYGDGTLILFSSTVNAVECAQDVQIAFQEPPEVPLRIGIHVGEFVRKDNDVFGNGINIAARIESIGVAGSVLFSNDVTKRIKNHPEFQTISLGHFNFKHVEEEIEVFALTNDNFAIPKRADIQGKARRSISKNFKWILGPIIGLLISGVAILGWWNNSSNKPVLTKQSTAGMTPVPNLTKQSIAVLPFANMLSLIHI